MQPCQESRSRRVAARLPLALVQPSLAFPSTAVNVMNKAFLETPKFHSTISIFQENARRRRRWREVDASRSSAFLEGLGLGHVTTSIRPLCAVLDVAVLTYEEKNGAADRDEQPPLSSLRSPSSFLHPTMSFRSPSLLRFTRARALESSLHLRTPFPLNSASRGASLSPNRQSLRFSSSIVAVSQPSACSPPFSRPQG